MMSCCQNVSAEVSFSLRWYVVCEDYFADPETVYVFDNDLGVFEEGTRLAMPKTILRVGLIVIKDWFRGY